MEKTIKQFNTAYKYVALPTPENWQELCKKIIDNQGEITGKYPTNFVTREDVEQAVNDESISRGEIELNDKLMRDIANCIGESDTDNGTYWEALKTAYYDLTK